MGRVMLTNALIDFDTRPQLASLQPGWLKTEKPRGKYLKTISMSGQK